MRLLLSLIAAFAVAGCGQAPAPGVPPLPADYPAQVEQWRAKHEADYRRNYSTIAGLHPLQQGRNTAGADAGNDVVLQAAVPGRLGTFVLTGEQVTFEPAPGVPVLLRDQPLTAAVPLQDDSAPEPDELQIAEVRMVIHRSGPTRSLRVRDPQGPLAKGFLGFRWFDIDPRFRVTGRFIPDAQPKSLPVMNTYGDLDTFTSEGVVEFTLDGRTLRLRPFTTRPKRFWFVFRDASSGSETYEAARFLYADLQDDGTTVLDFNQAYNPPCAFNPYTTCPIPIPENRLPIKVLAGEKAYPKQVEPAKK
jgi:hypothetical protein